jgi:hypothetical protein
MQMWKQTNMKCKWYNTRKMPTYLYLPVMSGLWRVVTLDV